MENVIRIQIETESNIFIGGMPMPFEIGGIDQQTVTDQNGNPYIPASSLKGALRNIVHEMKISKIIQFENMNPVRKGRNKGF